MTYSDRFISLGIESLYCRHVKADLLMCYNILTNRVCLASIDFFTLSVTTLCFKKKFTLLLFAITKSDVDRFQ